MEIVSYGVIGLGFLATVVSGIWLLILAFQKNILWGLAYLFLPFASFVFVFMNWDRAGKPFLISIASTVAIVAGVFMNPTIMQSLKESAASDGAATSTASSAPR